MCASHVRKSDITRTSESNVGSSWEHAHRARHPCMHPRIWMHSDADSRGSVPSTEYCFDRHVWCNKQLFRKENKKGCTCASFSLAGRTPVHPSRQERSARRQEYPLTGVQDCPGPLREHQDAAKAQIRWWRNSGGAAFTHTGRSDTRMNYSSIGGCTKRFALTAILSAMIALFWLVIEPAGAVSLFHPIPKRVHERCTRK